MSAWQPVTEIIIMIMIIMSAFQYALREEIHSHDTFTQYTHTIHSHNTLTQYTHREEILSLNALSERIN